MSQAFDPYHEWLGIAPKDQPPHLYRLLGVDALESNLKVIENAAEQRAAHLRSRQMGKQGEATQKLLNEVAAARVTLLTPEKKAAYDAELAKALGVAAPKPAKEKLVVAKPLDSSPAPAPALGPAIVPSASPAARPATDPPIWQNPLVLGGAGLALAAVIGVVIWVSQMGKPPVVGVNPPEKPPVVKPVDKPPMPPAVVPKPVDPPMPPPVAPVDPASPFTPIPPPMDPPVAPTPPVVAPVDPVPAPVPVPVPTPEPAPPAPAPTPVVEAAPKRAALPDAQATAAATKDIRDLFKADLVVAKTPELKSELARKVAKIAADEPAGSTSRYAALQLAREFAIAGLDAETIATVCDWLEAGYEVDPKLRSETLVAALEAPGPVPAKKPLAEAVLASVDGLLADNEFVAAGDILKSLTDSARLIKDRDFTQAIADRRKLGTELFGKFREVQPAFEVLKTKPDDAEANATAGRYLCLIKGDFERGLPHLARSGDAVLAPLAKNDQANPTEPKAKLAVADGWFDFAAKATAAEKPIARERAALWYREAAGTLTGLERARAEKRIAELPEPQVRAGGVVLPVTYLDTLPIASQGRFEGRLGIRENPFVGGPLKWEGKEVEHGLFMTARTRQSGHLEFQLDGKYSRLVGLAAMIPWKETGIKVNVLIFRVYADNKVIFETRPLSVLGESQEVDLSLRGVKVLKIESQCPERSDGSYFAFLSPKLYGQPTRSVRSAAPPPVAVQPPVGPVPVPISPMPMPVGPAPPVGPVPVSPMPAPLDPAALAGLEVTYLDTLPTVSVGRFESHLGIRQNAITRGKLMWEGKEVEHGLFMHPQNRRAGHVDFQLDGKYVRLQGLAALIPHMEGKVNPTFFRVYADEKQIFETRGLTTLGESQAVDVPLAGVKMLRIESFCPDRSGGCWFAFLSPKLYGKPAQPAVVPAPGAGPSPAPAAREVRATLYAANNDDQRPLVIYRNGEVVKAEAEKINKHAFKFTFTYAPADVLVLGTADRGNAEMAFLLYDDQGKLVSYSKVGQPIHGDTPAFPEFLRGRPGDSAESAVGHARLADAQLRDHKEVAKPLPDDFAAVWFPQTNAPAGNLWVLRPGK